MLAPTSISHREPLDAGYARRRAFSITELSQKLRSPTRTRSGASHRSNDDQQVFFFRDKVPFDRFRDTILPAMLTARANTPPSDLVHRRLNRPGTLFLGHDPSSMIRSSSIGK